MNQLILENAAPTTADKQLFVNAVKGIAKFNLTKTVDGKVELKTDRDLFKSKTQLADAQYGPTHTLTSGEVAKLDVDYPVFKNVYIHLNSKLANADVISVGKVAKKYKKGILSHEEQSFRVRREATLDDQISDLKSNLADLNGKKEEQAEAAKAEAAEKKAAKKKPAKKKAAKK